MPRGRGVAPSEVQKGTEVAKSTSGALARIPHMLAAGEGGLTVSSLPVYRQSILLVHFLCCIGSVSSLDDTVAPVTRDAGGGGPAEASVRSTARRLVSLHLMSLRPYAQLMGGAAQARSPIINWQVAQNPNMRAT